MVMERCESKKGRGISEREEGGRGLDRRRKRCDWSSKKEAMAMAMAMAMAGRTEDRCMDRDRKSQSETETETETESESESEEEEEEERIGVLHNSGDTPSPIPLEVFENIKDCPSENPYIRNHHQM